MDIAVDFGALGESPDWQLNQFGTDLLADSTLKTAVLISLYTDAQADADDILPGGDGDRRGSWMDIPLDDSPATDSMGSRLWLLERAKAGNQTLIDAKAYAEEALQWLIDDGIAASVTVDAAYDDANFLALSVTIAQAQGGPPVRFANIWTATLAR